jgi:thiamine pyrophosphate-dependent acetolactate synthase large subunit-like protein
VIRRRDAVARLVAERGDALFVAGLGATAWDLAAAGDDPRTFPLWGAMGGACALGLGLALAQPTRRVVVVTGDGEALMSLGSFATIAAAAPANLAVVVIDNERYGETGGQPTHTAHPTDLARVAAGCGIASATTIRDEGGLGDLSQLALRQPGPVVVVIKVDAHDEPLVLPPRDAALLKHRLRSATLPTP